MNELETAGSAPSALAQRLYRRLAEPAGVIQTQQLPGRQTQAAAQALIQRSQLPAQVQSRYGAVGIIQPSAEVPARSRVESLGENHGRSPELAQPARDIGEVIGLPTLDSISPAAGSSGGDSSFASSSVAPVPASAPPESSGGMFRVSRQVASDLPRVDRAATPATPLVSAPLPLAVAGPAVEPDTVGAIARSPNPDDLASPASEITAPERSLPFRGRVQHPSMAQIMRQAESATVIPSPAISSPAIPSLGIPSPATDPLPISPLPLAAPGLQRSPGLSPETPDAVHRAGGDAPLPVRAELRSPTTAPVVTVQRQVEADTSSSVALPLGQAPSSVRSSGARATPPIMATLPNANAGGAPLTLARQPLARQSLPGMAEAAEPVTVLPQMEGLAAIAPLPLPLHTPVSGVIAREPMDSSPPVPATPATPAPPPPAPSPGSTSESHSGPDIKQLAEQVSRILHRQLTVERERRGISQW